MPYAIEACIFDLDGVLVETSKFHFLAWSRLGNELGVEMTDEMNERLKGVSRRKSLECLLDLACLEPDEKEKVEMEERKNRWYLEYLKGMSMKDVLPGVVSFLDELTANGIRMAVGSSSKNARTILDKLEIIHRFEVIIDGNSVIEAKPHPGIFFESS